MRRTRVRPHLLTVLSVLTGAICLLLGTPFPGWVLMVQGGAD